MTNVIILLNGIVVGMLVYKTDRLRHEVNNLAKSQLQLIDVLQRLLHAQNHDREFLKKVLGSP